MSFDVTEAVAFEFGPSFSWAHVTIPANVFGSSASLVTVGASLQTTIGFEL